MSYYDAALIYAGEDLPLAERVAESLQRLGLKVWFDRLLGPGASFSRETIRDVFDRSACVVPLLSIHAARSEWVRFELGLAEEMQMRFAPGVIGDWRPARDRHPELARLFVDHEVVELIDQHGRISDDRIGLLAALIRGGSDLAERPAAAPRGASLARLIGPALIGLAAILYLATRRPDLPVQPSLEWLPLPTWLPSAAQIATGSWLIGGGLCLVAVLLWLTRHALERVSARRVVRELIDEVKSGATAE